MPLRDVVAQGQALHDAPFRQSFPGQLLPVFQQGRVAGTQQDGLAVGHIERGHGIVSGQYLGGLRADAPGQVRQHLSSGPPCAHGQVQGQAAEVLHQLQGGGQANQPGDGLHGGGQQGNIQTAQGRQESLRRAHGVEVVRLGDVRILHNQLHLLTFIRLHAIFHVYPVIIAGVPVGQSPDIGRQVLVQGVTFVELVIRHQLKFHAQGMPDYPAADAGDMRFPAHVQHKMLLIQQVPHSILSCQAVGIDDGVAVPRGDGPCIVHLHYAPSRPCWRTRAATQAVSWARLAVRRRAVSRVWRRMMASA
nr:MAG TPA_asm: hypothetical protein [Caudoviricetes sp.]